MLLTLKSLSSIYHMCMTIYLDYGALFWAVNHANPLWWTAGLKEVKEIRILLHLDVLQTYVEGRDSCWCPGHSWKQAAETPATTRISSSEGRVLSDSTPC